MNAQGRRLQRIVVGIALSFAMNGGIAVAQEGDAPTREAAKHFQRGVALYGEADYHAALVEFKRAYTLAPNAAVLYNVGETEYQLLDYAGALTTFRRYLVESSPTDSHRTEVEGNVEVLRVRVGHLSVSTVPAGADVLIDDQSVGKTPLDQAVLVSVGHRKVVAAVAGRPVVTRYVDVAAEDNVFLTLPLPPGAEASSAGGPSQRSTLPSDVPPTSRGGGAPLRVAGWIATTALAGGAVTFGLLANKEANDLKNARNSFPTTLATLYHDANLTTTYSIIADSLTAAAVLVGGITLFSTLSSSSSRAPARGSAGETRVMLGPTSARVQWMF